MLALLLELPTTACQEGPCYGALSYFLARLAPSMTTLLEHLCVFYLKKDMPCLYLSILLWHAKFETVTFAGVAKRLVKKMTKQ